MVGDNVVMHLRVDPADELDRDSSHNYETEYLNYRPDVSIPAAYAAEDSFCARPGKVPKDRGRESDASSRQDACVRGGVRLGDSLPATAERLAAERLAAERLAAERLTAERLAGDRLAPAGTGFGSVSSAGDRVGTVVTVGSVRSVGTVGPADSVGPCFVGWDADDGDYSDGESSWKEDAVTGPRGAGETGGSKSPTHDGDGAATCSETGDSRLLPSRDRASAPLLSYSKRVVSVLGDVERRNKAGCWPTETSVACYWCCQRFSGPPIGLPVRCFPNALRKSRVFEKESEATEWRGGGRATEERPMASAPGSFATGTSKPGTSKPGTSKPGTSRPGTSEPGTSEPGTPEPVTSEPGTSEPAPSLPDPDRGEDGFFSVGNFCSVSCAAAYNFDSRESTDTVCERHAMLSCLYSMLLGGQARGDAPSPFDATVRTAPPRTVLKMFGGHMSIEEFRAQSQGASSASSVFLENVPPLRCLSMQVEEVDEQDVGNRFTFVPIDQDRVERGMKELTLRRGKSLLGGKGSLDLLQLASGHGGYSAPSVAGLSAPSVAGLSAPSVAGPLVFAAGA